MAIDVSSAAADYKTGTASKADKLVRKYTQKTGKLDAAKSPAAQALYVQKMSDPAVLARRVQNLNKVSEADMNAAMQNKGRAAYANGTANSGDKWARNFTPYASVLDSTVANLPARTTDVSTNISNRVVPVAVALSDKKKEIG